MMLRQILLGIGALTAMASIAAANMNHGTNSSTTSSDATVDSGSVTDTTSPTTMGSDDELLSDEALSDDSVAGEDMDRAEEGSLSGTTSGPSSTVNMPADNTSSTTSGTTTGNRTGTSTGTTTGTTTGTVDANSKTTKPMGSTAATAIKRGERYQVIDFRSGSATLSESGKKSLRAMFDAAKARGSVSEVHVAAWSDKAFPTNNQDLPEADRKLAEQRADAIETYFESLQASDIATYNMAERSNWFARAFNTEEGELKSLFSQSGAPANIDAQEFRAVKTAGGPMKAVVLIEMADTAATAPGMNGASGTTGTSGTMNK